MADPGPVVAAEGTRAMKDDRPKWIAKAKREDISLSPRDFKLIDGEWTLDGMDPDEWIEAMVMD